YVMLNSLAFAVSGDQKYADAAQRFAAKQAWMDQTIIGATRDAMKQRLATTGNAGVVANGGFPFAKALLQPGEMLCWETVGLNEFVAVSAVQIAATSPRLLGGDLEPILAMWWREWRYGTGDDMLPYYWFALDLLKDTWHPLPSTSPLPKGQWPFGDPTLSY